MPGGLSDFMYMVVSYLHCLKISLVVYLQDLTCSKLFFNNRVMKTCWISVFLIYGYCLCLMIFISNQNVYVDINPLSKNLVKIESRLFLNWKYLSEVTHSFPLFFSPFTPLFISGYLTFYVSAPLLMLYPFSWNVLFHIGKSQTGDFCFLLSSMVLCTPLYTL